MPGVSHFGQQRAQTFDAVPVQKGQHADQYQWGSLGALCFQILGQECGWPLQSHTRDSNRTCMLECLGRFDLYLSELDAFHLPEQLVGL